MTVTLDQLFSEILMARERVYAVGQPTPLQRLPAFNDDFEIWVKREDLGPIKAYKWRGAYNAMAALTDAQRASGIVAASAGNHAQGVALAAKSLGCKATIFMPRSTPEVKQSEVLRHGGEMVEIQLVGDTYDDAGLAALAYCDEHQATYIHPYNDPATMGGQGTLADEIVMSGQGAFDRVYLAVGGGGLASSVACWLKKFWPQVKVIGVEGVDQASMKSAIAAGQPVALEYVDVFCDGTAVRKVGSNTHQMCSQLLDDIVTVTNDEVCHAIRMMWENLRVIPEPSGAMGLAGILQDRAAGHIQAGERVLTVICGANMDFAQLSMIARKAGIGSRKRRFMRVHIPEGRGTLVNFLASLPEGISIVDVQYGRVAGDMQFPVLGLIGSEDQYHQLDQHLSANGITSQDVSLAEDVGYRIINYSPELFERVLFVNIEFPERAGAFLEFMSKVSQLASLCYFNYAYSGERVGRALVGMEFASDADRASCEHLLSQLEGESIRSARAVSDETFYRLTGRNV